MKTYKVVLEPIEDGYWMASVPSVQGCRTQGPSISHAKRRIRDALSLFVGDDVAENAELEFEMKLPPSVKTLVEQLRKVSEMLEKCEVQAKETLASTLKAMEGMGFTVRQKGELLGLSFQRVHQLSQHQAPKRAARPGAKRASHG